MYFIYLWLTLIKFIQNVMSLKKQNLSVICLRTPSPDPVWSHIRHHGQHTEETPRYHRVAVESQSRPTCQHSFIVCLRLTLTAVIHYCISTGLRSFYSDVAHVGDG